MFEQGDVVDIGGMRGIVREVKEDPGVGETIKIAAGRTDDGDWFNAADARLVYRDGEVTWKIGHCDNDKCDVVAFRYRTTNRCPSCGQFQFGKGKGE